jgi:uncharacterized membrane protein YdjX (TVP38/TMEM64 family)
LLKKIRKIFKELGHLTPMALVMLFLPILGFLTLIALLVPVGDWLRSNWEIGTLIYFVAVVLLCGLSLIPTNVIGVLGGWAFGFSLGLFVLISAVVSAATLSFFINKRISGRKLPNAASKYVKVDAIYRELMRNDLRRTTFIIFLLRLSVVMPFAFTNFLLASARVPLGAYVIGTFAGMLPRSATVAFAGAGLAQLDPNNEGDVIALAVGLVATLVSIFVISRYARRALRELAEQRTEKDQIAAANV